jgi:hypothetical protein
MNRLNPESDEAKEIDEYYNVSIAELDKEMQFAVEFVRTLTTDHPSSVMPQVIVVGARETDDGGAEKDARGIYVVASDFNEPEQKQPIMDEIGKSCVREAKLIPKMAVLISEAWRSAGKMDGEWVRPSQHPERREQVIIIGMTAHKVTMFYGIPILRNSENGIHLALDEIERHEGGDCLILAWFFRGVFEAIAEFKKAKGLE